MLTKIFIRVGENYLKDVSNRLEILFRRKIDQSGLNWNLLVTLEHQYQYHNTGPKARTTNKRETSPIRCVSQNLVPDGTDSLAVLPDFVAAPVLQEHPPL
jgi:hypothetical protein